MFLSLMRVSINRGMNHLPGTFHWSTSPEAKIWGAPGGERSASSTKKNVEGGEYLKDVKYPVHPIRAATAITINYTATESQTSFTGIYSLQFVAGVGQGQ